MNAPYDIRAMTAESIGKDLLGALVTEIRPLPDMWPRLSEARQDDIIDRLRARVEDNVKMAVHLIASDGRTVVAGALDQITIKDGVKAVVKFGPNAENLHQLYEEAGKSVLVVVTNPAAHTGGMDEIHGEADQRAMELGHEYHENDGGGMNTGDTAIEGEVLGLPSPDDVRPDDTALEEAYHAGYDAAAQGKGTDDAPLVRSELVAEWLRGWRAWNDKHEGGKDARNGDKNGGKSGGKNGGRKAQ